jgi:hypothetical protein
MACAQPRGQAKIPQHLRLYRCLSQWCGTSHLITRRSDNIWSIINMGGHPQPFRYRICRAGAAEICCPWESLGYYITAPLNSAPAAVLPPCPLSTGKIVYLLLLVLQPHAGTSLITMLPMVRVILSDSLFSSNSHKYASTNVNSHRGHPP